MTDPHRRHTLKLMLAGAAAPLALKAAAIDNAATRPAWRRGIEQQRQADAGNGTYRNPILAGDHPDPTILKDGRDYYMTFSPFSACPGLLIWHSTDLVNWAPVVAALTKPIGSVWAVDLCKHNGRYFIYLPAAPENRQASQRSLIGPDERFTPGGMIELDTGSARYLIRFTKILERQTGWTWTLFNAVRKLAP